MPKAYEGQISTSFCSQAKMNSYLYCLWAWPDPYELCLAHLSREVSILGQEAISWNNSLGILFFGYLDDGISISVSRSIWSREQFRHISCGDVQRGYICSCVYRYRLDAELFGSPDYSNLVGKSVDL